MSSWPNGHEKEWTIIQQFESLQERVTAESAVELCQNAPGCGYLMELYEARHLSYEGAFQAYLAFLRSVVRLVSRSQFLYLFPKSCPGCATLQFLCILCLHPILENEVNDLFRDLLCDPRGEILHRRDTRQLAMMIRQVYKRRENPFPYMGNCLDFEHESEAYKKAMVIGKLFSSEKFREFMKHNSTVGAQIAHEMMKDLQDDFRRSRQLEELLSKYEKLTSKDKVDK